MIEGKYEYYAFISYKREDEKWARWLQHRLEHFKLPSNLNGRTDLPKEIRPIFRDTTELTPGNLPDQIQKALEHSKFLILICSPRSAKSEWVNKEVETFLSLGRLPQIIPFIVEGELFSSNPEEECFPEAILSLPKEKELLGVSIDTMGREAAALKVIARMMELRFDILWQRYERDKKKKRNVYLSLLTLFVLSVIGVATYIWKQNNMIKEQYIKLELSSAKNNAQYAMELMQNGQLIKAEQVIRDCFQNMGQETNVDEIFEIEKALRYWYRLKFGKEIYGTAILSEGSPYASWFNSDGSYLYLNDGNLFLNKYDTETGQKEESIILPRNLNYILDFDGDTLLQYMSSDSVVHEFNIYTHQDNVMKKNLADQSVLQTGNLDDEICRSHNGKAAVVRIGNRYAIRDTQSNRIVRELNIGKEFADACLDDSISTIAIAIPNGNESYLDLDIEVWDLKDRIIKAKAMMTASSRSSMELSPNGKYLFFSNIGDLHCINLSDYPLGQIVKNMNINPVYQMTFNRDGSKMCFMSINSVYLWSRPSVLKKALDEIKFRNTNRGIKKGKNGKAEIVEYNGEKPVKTIKSGLKWQWENGYSSLSVSEDFKKIAISEGDQLIVYDVGTGRKLWSDTCDNLVMSSCFSSDGKILCTACWDGIVRIYDMSSGTILKRLIGAEERLEVCRMSEDDKYVMAMDFTGKTLLWIVSTGQLVDVCNVVDDEVPVFPTMHSLKNFLLSH